MGRFLTLVVGKNNAYHLSSAKNTLRCALSSSRRYMCNYHFETVPTVMLKKLGSRHLCISSLLQIKDLFKYYLNKFTNGKSLRS